MKKFSFTLLLFLGVYACTYGQIYRHYWLNDFGRNHTLNKRMMANAPTNHGFVLAATTQDSCGSVFNETVTRSGIVIMKLFRNYTIEQCRIFKTSNDESAFNYDFEVYDIYPNLDKYYICGKMSDLSTGAVMGFVGIVDTFLNQMTLHKFTDVEKLVSIYAESGIYFACGKKGNGGILVCNDNPGMYKVVNTEYPLYKIKAKNNGGEINVVGGDIANVIYLNAQTTFLSCVKWTFQALNNECISITNYPGNRQGVIISTSYQDSVYIYLLSDLGNCINVYSFQEPSGFNLFVKDINCSNSKLAVTGLYDDSGNQHAFFFRSNIIFPSTLTSPTYLRFPPSVPNASFKFYKTFFDFTDSLFHCGGYCDYNYNTTTFTGTPELLISSGEDDCAQTRSVKLYPQNTVQPMWFNTIIEFNIPYENQEMIGWDKTYYISDDCEGIINFNNK